MTEVAHLATMTWEEAQVALERAHLAILPVGSIEQHGPHLPLDTDAGVAIEIADRIAEPLGASAVVCPPMMYGLSEHHLPFSGTLTLRPSTFIAQVVDVVESLSTYGVRRVLAVNGHAGNVDALRLAGRQLRRDHGVLMAHVIWLALARDQLADHPTSTRFGHACEAETSVAMALRPETVRTQLLDQAADLPTFQPLSEPPWPFVDEPVPTREWTANGALGDPRAATVEFGAAIVNTAVERAVQFAKEFAYRPMPAEAEQPG